MKVIIVDDEPKAIELLKSYLNHFSSIELCASFRNGLKAYEYLSQNEVDLIFLDINMPHISGLSLSKILPKNVKVIFTTAYSEYAVESYEIQAVDYLVKPIGLERFTKAISRVLSSKQSASDTVSPSVILLKSGYETFRVELASILFLEKDGNYMLYHCLDKKIVTRESVQEALDKLPDRFVQCHKSYIVNRQKIDRYDRYELHIGQKSLPISDSHRDAILSALA